jgi:hypothetical protein
MSRLTRALCRPGGIPSARIRLNHIEQNNSRQRHWFARFKRRCVVVTRSLFMLELTMRLFATFHINGNDAPLLEMASSMIG